MARGLRTSKRDDSGIGSMTNRTTIGRHVSVLCVFGLSVLVLTGAVPGEVPVPGAEVAPRHITLDASIPEDEETVRGDVTEVRLFFSDAPLMRGASIRIVNASRKLQRSTPPVADEEDGRQLSVRLSPALPPGKYVVQWRCIADDGHVMRGDFTFEVAAQ